MSSYLRPMAADGMRIKAEPRDDDPMEGVATIPHETLFVQQDELAQTSTARAKDSEGKSFTTLCFTGKFLDHPHHHRLICGHTIITDQIEKCGSNCAPSKKAEKKPSTTPFACPHSDCQKQMKRASRVFLPKQQKGRANAKPRKCELSHVYGIDKQADEERAKEKEVVEDEKANLEMMDERGRRLVLRDRGWLLDKRSPSPDGGSTSFIPQRRQNPPRSTASDPAETANRALDEEKPEAREALLAMSGPGVLDRKDGRYVTRLDRSAQQLQDMFVDPTIGEQKQLRKQEREQEFMRRAGEAERMESVKDQWDPSKTPSPKIDCDVCEQTVLGLQMHCFDCPNYDMCPNCCDDRRGNHPTSHNIRAVRRPNDWVHSTQLDKFPPVDIVCPCTDAVYMVLCDTCDSAFHPGCVGKGMYSEDSYAEGHKHRKDCLARDHERWAKEKVKFDCPSCTHTAVDTAAPGEKVVTDREARANTRQQTNMLNWLRQQTAGLEQYLRADQKKRMAKAVAGAKDIQKKINLQEYWYGQAKKQAEEETEANEELGIGQETFLQGVKRRRGEQADQDDELEITDSSAFLAKKRKRNAEAEEPQGRFIRAGSDPPAKRARPMPLPGVGSTFALSVRPSPITSTSRYRSKYPKPRTQPSQSTASHTYHFGCGRPYER